ncbi:hypothetical protein BDR07DRAFT_1617131 [Suillus spraguei]|nr:hypothetical protein BDR07DRAFT_1617131 [Suillus spraguei]
MPATRTQLRSTKESIDDIDKASIVVEEIQDLADCKIHYPLSEKDRNTFKTRDGKRVTPHQWQYTTSLEQFLVAVLRRTRTYASLLGKVRRDQVGSALRNNPFATVCALPPHHRIKYVHWWILW